tara:strand:+ start:168 stop:416 length:249 start_codon:yes stop_codon:yes gene_type:complete
MNKQPELETPKSWEELTSRLLKLYAKSLIELYDKGYTAVTETASASNFRRDIRKKIVEIGQTLDQTEKNYNELLLEYGKQEI